MPPKKTAAAKKGEPETFEQALAALRAPKAMSKTPIGVLDDFNMVPDPLSTGNITIDTLTAIGGFPKGAIIELRGKPSSGKTTSALQASAELWKREKGRTLFLDYERTLDPVYCRALGIETDNPDAFLVVQPDTFEDGANLFRRLLKTGGIQMLIVDSVATMVTQSELDAETGKATMADRAKMMHQFLRQIVSQLRKQNCAAVFLNHIMDLVDITPMGQQMAAKGIKRQTSPGGTALPFYASLRIDFNQAGNKRTDQTDVLTGEKIAIVSQTDVKATVIKNKVGDPFRTAMLRVRFGKGFSQAYSVYSILVSHGVIAKNVQGGKHTFKGELGPEGETWTEIGEEKVLAAMEEDPAWLERLTIVAQEVVDAHGVEYASKEEIEAIKAENAEIDEMGKAQDDEEQDPEAEDENDALTGTDIADILKGD
jgi:recombination protein RecA